MGGWLLLAQGRLSFCCSRAAACLRLTAQAPMEDFVGLHQQTYLGLIESLDVVAIEGSGVSYPSGPSPADGDALPLNSRPSLLLGTGAYFLSGWRTPR